MRLLLNPDVRKVGVGLQQDTQHFYKHRIFDQECFVRFGRDPYPIAGEYGFFDVGLYARNHLRIPARGATELNALGGNHGVESLCEKLLSLGNAKGLDLSFSDWANPRIIEYVPLFISYVSLNYMILKIFATSRIRSA